MQKKSKKLEKTQKILEKVLTYKNRCGNIIKLSRGDSKIHKKPTKSFKKVTKKQANKTTKRTINERLALVNDKHAEVLRGKKY